MGLFDKKEITIYSPLDGELKPLAKMADQTFAQKILGDGVCIVPTSSIAYSPLDKGSVVNAFHTGHAYGLSTGKGPEILFHIGMDTVLLEGEGFDIKVKNGDRLTLNTVLCDFDLKTISKNVPSMDTPIIAVTDSMND
jgi:PTS system glucose-specific IIA component